MLGIQILKEGSIYRTYYLISFSVQNKALWKLKQFQVIQGKSNEIWLNPIFRTSFIQAITDTKTLWTGKITPDQQLADEHFQKVWNGILYAIATGGQAHERYAKVTPGIINCLINSNILLKEQTKLTITNNGFQFLLADSAEQVATLIIQYCMDLPDTELLDALITIMIVSFIVPEMSYDMKVLSVQQKKHIKFLSDLGVVHCIRSSFIPTRLSKAITYTGEQPLQVTKEEGFLVLETNYKFYAYTNSSLHLSILSLFMNIRTKFPNMIHGQLSQDSVTDAFKKGITAAQIIRFLTSSAHNEMRLTLPILPPTITDQITLWEQDRNRLKAKPGYLYQQFLSSADFEKVVAEANRVVVVLYANPSSRMLVVSETGHSQIKTFVKNNL